MPGLRVTCFVIVLARCVWLLPAHSLQHGGEAGIAIILFSRYSRVSPQGAVMTDLD